MDFSLEAYITLSSINLKSTTPYFLVLFKAGNALSKATVARIALPGSKGSILGRCGNLSSP